MASTSRRTTRSSASASPSSSTFDILVVGCGGGPLETDLSSYLVKPRAKPWSEGCIALEAGSGVGALTQLLATQTSSFGDFQLPSADPAANALHILSLIRSYVISHAHLDHVAGLVLSAGSVSPCRPLFGIPRTLTNLARIFDGGVWPALASYEDSTDNAYVYKSIEPGGSRVDVGAGMKLRAMPCSHGCATSSTYESSAFFLSTAWSDRELLFFGDVEPDSISKWPLNRPIWEEAARLVCSGQLAAVFIECSYPSSRPTELLYGHLSPPHLLDELTTFAKLVDPTFSASPVVPSRPRKRSSSARPLEGLPIYIIHIKRTPGAFEAIREELRVLEEERGLGCRFVVVEQGMRIEV